MSSLIIVHERDYIWLYVAFRLVSMSLLAYLSTRLEFNMINIIINSWKINLWRYLPDNKLWKKTPWLQWSRLFLSGRLLTHAVWWLMETFYWQMCSWLCTNDLSCFPAILFSHSIMHSCRWLFLFLFAMALVWVVSCTSLKVASQAYLSSTDSAFYLSKDPCSRSNSDMAT